MKSELLLSETLMLAREERRITLELIHHLREIERRMLFAELGFSSLFDFAVKHLGLSEGAASRRIGAMRLIQDVPELSAKIESGTMKLSTAAQAQRFFQAEQKIQGVRRSPEEKRDVLRELEGRSQRECEKVLQAIAPEATRSSEKERVISADETELRVIVPEKTLQKLRRLEAVFSNRLARKSGGRWAELLDLMADELLRKFENKRGAQRTDSSTVEQGGLGVAAAGKASLDLNPDSLGARQDPVAPQYRVSDEEPDFSASFHFPGMSGGGVAKRKAIPAARVREVRTRAGGRCEFISAQGRCGSVHRVEIDHIRPVSMGGSDELGNLRLLCRTHNLYEARRLLTTELMAKFVPRMR